MPANKSNSPPPAHSTAAPASFKAAPASFSPSPPPPPSVLPSTTRWKTSASAGCTTAPVTAAGSELFAGPVTKGQDGYLAGGSLLWRYNFIQPGARLIPYLQLGAGALGNDVFVDRAQREIGGAFEFDLQADLGLKYLINDRWSLSLEADYRHISNADIYSRNQGLNSIGGLMQLSYSFH